MHFRQRVSLRIWTNSAHSKGLKVGQNCNSASDHKFRRKKTISFLNLWSCANLLFWFTFKLLECALLVQIRSWTLDPKCIFDAFLREVAVDEAPPLKKFSSKPKGKSFSLFKLGDPKLPYLISGLTSFQSPDMY